jgi:hypothetical protein
MPPPSIHHHGMMLRHGGKFTFKIFLSLHYPVSLLHAANEAQLAHTSSVFDFTHHLFLKNLKTLKKITMLQRMDLPSSSDKKRKTPIASCRWSSLKSKTKKAVTQDYRQRYSPIN